MRAKTGRWWTFFTVCFVTGMILAWQPAWAINFADNTLDAIPQEVNEDDEYKFNLAEYIENTDPNADINYGMEEKPPWLSIDANGLLSGTPLNEHVTIWKGLYLIVDDVSSADRIGPFQIEVRNTNDPPTISGSPDTTVYQNKNYYFKPTANDMDGDNLTFSITTNEEPGEPEWANELSAQGELTGTPGNEHVGVYVIIITVQDDPPDGSEPLTDDLGPFSIEVLNTNDPPEIIPYEAAPDSIPQAYVDKDKNNDPETVDRGDAYTYVLQATDIDEKTPDGETLAFDSPELPGWLTHIPEPAPYGSIVNKENRPNNADATSEDGNSVRYNIDLTVRDDAEKPLTDTYSFSVTVNNENDRPRISGTPATEVLEKNTYEFIPTSSDPDGDDLIFSATYDGNPDNAYPQGWPDWLVFDKTDGSLIGHPENEDAGTIVSQIEITAIDGPNDDPSTLSTTLEPFSITVKNVNDRPELTLLYNAAPPEDTITIKQNDEFILRVKGKDVDTEDSLSFTVENPPKWSEFTRDPSNPETNNPGSYFLRSKAPLTQSDVGEYTVTFLLDDGLIEIPVSKTIGLVVENVNDAPTFTQAFVDNLSTISPIDEMAAFSLQAEATDKDPEDQDKLIYNAYITLPGGSEATYSNAEGASQGWPDWLSFDPNTGLLSIAENATDDEEIGVYTLQLEVSDKKLSDLTDSFSLEIVNVNEAPVISGTPQPKVGIPAQDKIDTVGKGTLFSFTPEVSDPDSPAQDRVFITKKIPDWMTFSIDSANGTITFENKAKEPAPDTAAPTPPEENGDMVHFQVFDNDPENSLRSEMTFYVRLVENLNVTTGDFNGDGSSDLSDAILGLQILVGINYDGYIWLSKADTNADNVFGIQDVIYILKDMAAQ